jgi:two-component system sensor histidine kinase QseC
VHAQNAARASSPAEREASLARMLQGLERTVCLAEQMLAYSRAAAPGEPARRERVALKALAQEAAESVQARAQERRCTIEVAADADLAVTGERQKLLSLATNLLDNAVRYGPEGGRVRLELRRDRGAAVLAVSDEGPGIAPELRQRVFASYYRVPGAAGGGSGLGLAIVKEVAEAHGAQVAIEAGPRDRGTRVVVRFDAAPGT